jgi:hypothetical protein
MKQALQQIAEGTRRGLSVLGTILLSGFLAWAQSPSPSGSFQTTEFDNAGDTMLKVLFYLGAVILVGGLIFAAFRFFADRPMQGVMGVAAAIVGALILGYSKGWIGTMTGIQLN